MSHRLLTNLFTHYLHYHTQPSTEIRGVILPVCVLTDHQINNLLYNSHGSAQDVTNLIGFTPHRSPMLLLLSLLYHSSM